MSEIQHNLNDREVATVLHALRSLQFGCNSDECDHFDDNVEPLNSDEIDALCERINLAPKHASSNSFDPSWCRGVPALCQCVYHRSRRDED